MKNNIKKLSTKSLLSAILLFLTFLSGSIYSEALPTILPTLLQAMPKTLMLKLLLMATTICVLLFAFSLILYLKLKRKFILKFSIYWDNKANPHCPICKTPLQTGERSFLDLGSANLTCPKCDKSFLMRDDSSKITHLKTAKKSILGKKYNF